MYKYLNVKENFGAKGDGVTDDTTSIQAAINSLSFAGGAIFFPEGRYLINSTITIQDKGPLIIFGQSSNLMKGTSANHSSQIVPSGTFGTTTAIFDIVSSSGNDPKDHGGITFKDIMIRPSSGTRGYAINVSKGTGDTSFWGDIKLDNVCIRQCTTGLRLTNSGGVGYGWIYVIGSRIEACTYGVWADCAINSSVFRDSIIRQNTQSSNSSYTSRSGGGLILPYGDAITIEGCDLEANQVAIQSSASNMIIHGNYFEACYDASIVLSAAQYVSIIGNLFADDYKTKQIYIADCNSITGNNNEGAQPVLVSSNRDVFFDNYNNAILSCVDSVAVTTATQTVSNVTALFWSESAISKLAAVEAEAIYKPSTTPGGVITNWTLGAEGPLGKTNLVAIATSTSGNLYFNPAYADAVSSLPTNANACTVNIGTDIITTTSNHGFLDGDQVSFYSTSGISGMPTGISTGTWYYVINKTSNTFKVASTHAGSGIDITSSGVGTLYVTNKPEFYTQNFWIKAPKTNTAAAPYIESRKAINGLGGSVVYYISTPTSIVFPKDEWLLMQVIEKLPAGVLAPSGYDCNTRIYQTTVNDSTYISGIAGTKTRSLYTIPKHFFYFTNISNENFLMLDSYHYRGTAIPTSTIFPWYQGTQIEYTNASGGGYLGSVCTASGAPGTWKTFGPITA